MVLHYYLGYAAPMMRSKTRWCTVDSTVRYTVVLYYGVCCYAYSGSTGRSTSSYIPALLGPRWPRTIDNVTCQVLNERELEI